MTTSSSDAGRKGAHGGRRGEGTLLLRRSEVAALLPLDDCIAGVEAAFRLHAQGRTLRPAVLGVPSGDGGFHLKTAGLTVERTWFAVKCNGNFPGNPARLGMPAIQGMIVLYDGDDGSPLAVLDSTEITTLRTGAATALAAKHLAREDARVATICGCGNQGRAQLRSLLRVRALDRVFAFDADLGVARAFAVEMAGECGIAVEPVADLPAAARASDIIVTCTPARRYILDAGDVRPGTFVAGVGADSETKWEIDPQLFARARVVVDSLDQCAAIGDLHHALESGAIARDAVHAELVDLIAGRVPGRQTPDEITLFDSTGVALEDVGAAVMVYRRALAQGAGLRLDFGS